MKTKFTILLFLLVNFCFAQNPKVNPYQNNKYVNCDLFEKNEIW